MPYPVPMILIYSISIRKAQDRVKIRISKQKLVMIL